MGLRDHKFTVAVFVDVKNAFEGVNIEILLEQFKVLGTSEHICNILRGLFSQKELTIQTDTQHIKRYSFSGTPQGGVLSSLSFDVYTNNVLDGIGICALAYADDIVLYTSNSSLVTAVEQVQTAIDKLTNPFFRQIKSCYFSQEKKISNTARYRNKDK